MEELEKVENVRPSEGVESVHTSGELLVPSPAKQKKPKRGKPRIARKTFQPKVGEVSLGDDISVVSPPSSYDFHEEVSFNIYTHSDRVVEVTKFTKSYRSHHGELVQMGTVPVLQTNKGKTSTTSRYDANSVGDVFLHQGQSGSVKPLLFVHGWGLTSRSYREPLKRLTNDYDVYAPTLPGFGKSSPLGIRFSLDDYAESVDRTWSECEIAEQSVPIVAHSMGAGVAVKLALQTRNNVESLTLICPIGGSSVEVDWGKIFASFKSDVTFEMLNRAKDSLPSLLRNPRGAVRSAFLAKTANLATHINECVESGLKVNIVFASHDSITPPGRIEKIPGVHYSTEEGTHGWLLKSPDRFGDSVLKLLS